MAPSPSLRAAVQSALDAGDLGAAFDACRERLRHAPDDADAHRHLAQLHVARAELSLARESARRACELAPRDPRAWSDLGRVHAAAREWTDAASCFEASVRLAPNYADGWHNLGTALRRLGRREPAFEALKQALLIDPARADTYLNLGNLLIDAGMLDDAVECFERATKHDPKLAAARSRLAQQYSQRGKVKRAEALFRQAVALSPGHLEGWLGLGRTLEDLGEAEGALGCYRNVLARRPDHALALGQYLGLVEEDAPEVVLESAQRALANEAADDEAKALIGYGLAKYHDRRGEIARAAASGIAANAARRRKAGTLDRAELTERVDRMIETYDRAFFDARRAFGSDSDQPVFIVGLPRSGTTLTEQILAAHPLLHGAGELPDLARLAARAVRDENRPFWQAALAVSEAKSRELANEYLGALRENAPPQRLRISDKSPLNFFQLALAAVLFPRAKFVHCRRDVRDNALSIWLENFNPSQHYATDFGDLAFFNAESARLMAHWHAALPRSILEIRYEETVADVETQARRLIDFLGAPWDARCVRFHESERAVQTPSRWQVRQPIYTRSVARWRGYAEHLPALGSLVY